MLVCAFCVPAALVAVVSDSVTAQASRDSARTPAPSQRTHRFCWQGRPLARCYAFALFELTTQSHLTGSKLDAEVTRPGIGGSRWDDALASHIVGDVGVMRNVTARTAIGATITAGSVQAGSKPVNIVGATVRYRRWLTKSVSADAGTGVLRMPVGIVVQSPWGPERKNVPRPAMVADARIGYRDLVSATGRLMLATDGQGRIHRALFVGASAGSKFSAVILGSFVAWAILFSPRGDKVTVQ